MSAAKTMNLSTKNTPELLELMAKVEANPANAMPSGSLYRFTPAARRKLDAIQRQITHNMAMKRAAEWRPVVADGYSGRQSNRRR
jgi:hypothetical protein